MPSALSSCKKMQDVSHSISDLFFETTPEPCLGHDVAKHRYPPVRWSVLFGLDGCSLPPSRRDAWRSALESQGPRRLALPSQCGSALQTQPHPPPPLRLRFALRSAQAPSALALRPNLME